MVGGPSDVRQLDQPTIGHTVAFGGVHGYVEAYGTGSNELTAKYEVAADDDSPALLTAEVTGRTAGAERMIFSHVLPVRQLPPGQVRAARDRPVGRRPRSRRCRAASRSPRRRC